MPESSGTTHHRQTILDRVRHHKDYPDLPGGKDLVEELRHQFPSHDIDILTKQYSDSGTVSTTVIDVHRHIVPHGSRLHSGWSLSFKKSLNTGEIDPKYGEKGVLLLIAPHGKTAILTGTDEELTQHKKSFGDYIEHPRQHREYFAKLAEHPLEHTSPNKLSLADKERLKRDLQAKERHFQGLATLATKAMKATPPPTQ